MNAIYGSEKVAQGIPGYNLQGRRVINKFSQTADNLSLQ